MNYLFSRNYLACLIWTLPLLDNGTLAYQIQRENKSLLSQILINKKLLASALRMATVSDEATGNLPKECDDDEKSEFQFSKSKWKKKRFLMMKDVNAAVQNRDTKATSKAEQMVRRMWTLYEKTGEVEFSPDLQAYNLWIHAVAKSKPHRHRTKDLAPGKRAELILEEMIERGINPNVVSYTSVVDAYANQGRMGDVMAPAEAERVLFDLLQRSEYTPNLQISAVTSDAVLNAWAQQGTWESAERAQQILQRLEAMTAKSGISSTKLVRPTSFSYATVIHAWAKSGGGAAAAQKANAILDRLLTKTNEHGYDELARPDTVVFNAVITAWASSGDPLCGSKAVELLRQMKELDESFRFDNCKPDVVTYNSVLSALSRSGHINSAVQAERILKEMIMARKADPESNPAPNVISYNTVLHAWSKSSLDGAAERAETLLKFMVKSEQGSIVPDAYSYSSVLDAIAKSKQPGKALRAKRLLEHMLEFPGLAISKLTPVPFNAVINAAAFSAVGTCDEEKREALEVASSTFQRMRRLGVEKDTISYGNMLKAVANLVSPGNKRYGMALRLFTDCCEKGLVEDLVWNEVQRCVPYHVLIDELGLKPIGTGQTHRLRELPKQWRRNQRAATSRRRRTTASTGGNGRGSVGGDGSESIPKEIQPRPFRRQMLITEPSWESGRDL